MPIRMNMPISFHFTTEEAAALAQDTLEELGYRVGSYEEGGRFSLHIHVDQGDLTSALEIAQAHGGELAAVSGAYDVVQTYTMAYDPEGGVPIPAHFVQEAEDDAELSASRYRNVSSGAYEDGKVGESDPSGDHYDRFDAGLHL